VADFGRLDDPTPHARLLGDGRYGLLVTGAGSGAARVGRLALTPWSADRTEDGVSRATPRVATRGRIRVAPETVTKS